MSDKPADVFDGVRQNTEYGAWELDPKPEATELNAFYLSKYYELIKKGGRAPILRRLMQGGDEAARERAWLSHTQFGDLEAVFRDHAPGRSVLDIGCGTGEFIEFLNGKGYSAHGLEISELAAEMAQKRGMNVTSLDFESFAAQARAEGDRYDVATLLNVLEHVPDAYAQIDAIKPLLNPNGLIAIVVPNDFNDLQLAAAEVHGLSPWWIARPDHINYFSHESLSRLLDQSGFDVVATTTSFPMEFFLLMGMVYPGDGALGAKCHAMRQAFEFALPTEQRRRFYQALTEMGWGRDCTIVGKLR
jgi:2-polyprenyl-3-methyl-5-hydroxy-6-metoxy-1,4-benzoquinol methylase